MHADNKWRWHGGGMGGGGLLGLVAMLGGVGGGGGVKAPAGCDRWDP